MTAPFKLGEPVRQVVHPVAGVAAKVAYDDGEDKFRVLVRSPDGSEHWFWADQIEADKPAETQTLEA